MYCSKCGKQNPDHINYCQMCGAPLGVTQQVKSKQEFLKDYHSNHPGYYVLCVLSIICDIIGAIVIISKIMSTKVYFGYITSSQERELVTAVIIGVVFWVVGSIFLIGAKGMDKSANDQYEQYMSGIVSRQVHLDSSPILNDSWICPSCGMRNQSSMSSCSQCGAKRVSNGYYDNHKVNEWQCPKCGRINQNYVGTCGCGEEKPK